MSMMPDHQTMTGALHPAKQKSPAHEPDVLSGSCAGRNRCCD